MPTASPTSCFFEKGSRSYLVCWLGTWLNAVRRAYVSNKGPRTSPWRIVSVCTLRTHPWNLGRSERISLLSARSKSLKLARLASFVSFVDLFLVSWGHLDKRQNDWQLLQTWSAFHATRPEYSSHKTRKMLQAYLMLTYVTLYDSQYFHY
jgi:hypothetical protein